MKPRIFTTIVIGMLVLSIAQATMAQQVSLVSVNSAGTGPGNNGSSGPNLSADGRFALFNSNATDLTPNDTNGALADVFVRDRVTGTTTLVSVNSAGTGSGNALSFGEEISANGRFVAFVSAASDLVTGDDSIGADIYIRDLVAGATTRIRASQKGVLGPPPSIYLSMTPDGQFLLFSTTAKDLVPGDRNSLLDVFVYDVNTHTTSLVSVNNSGVASGTLYYGDAAISDNGRYVAFGSMASNLVSEDNNNDADVFVRDLVAGVTTLVSVNYAGAGSADRSSHTPRISADGRKVAFISSAENLVSFYDANGYQDIFVRDLTLERTTLVSVSRRGRRTGNAWALQAEISANGRFVVFTSWATDLTRTDPYNGIITRRCDLFVRDLEMSKTTNLSANIPLPVPLNPFHNPERAHYPRISSDGLSVVFHWETHYTYNAYFGDVVTGEAMLMNINIKGTGSNEYSYTTSISADGRIGAFTSLASDLVLNDTNTEIDAFTFTPTRVNERFANFSAKHPR